MKIIIPLCIIPFLLIGCLTPSERIERAELVINQAESAIIENRQEQDKQVSGLVYATDLALDRAEESQPVNLARDFNDRTASIVGLPAPEEAVKLQQLVTDLLSEIEKEKQRGAESLAELDAKLTEVSREKESLQKKLQETEAKLTAIHKENSILADREAERESQWWNPFYDFWHGFKKSLGWIALIVAALLLLPIAAIFFPAFAPIIASLGHILGTAIGWLIHKIPGLLSGAGLIAQSTYNLTHSTLQKLVSTIESWQEKQKTLGKADYKELTSMLAQAMDGEHKEQVTKIKNA
ncbi:MAG: hypothetical protein V1746_03820 [bacterium]